MFTNMKFLPDAIINTIETMSNFILEYALALAATSVLAMALLEVWKSIFKTREHFHKRWICEWITESSVSESDSKDPVLGSDGYHNRVYRQLILLTTGQKLDAQYTLNMFQDDRFRLLPSNALFALELERMMGQIQEAADIVLSNPSVYKDLYWFLTQGANEDDISNWQKGAILVPEDDITSRKELKERVDAFSRLNKLVKRKLDSLQILMKYKWARQNQAWAITLGGVLLFASMAYIELSNLSWEALNPLTWLRIFVASIVGGIVAPVAKDLVASLKKVRQNG